MTLFFQTAAGVLLAVILSHVLSTQGKEFGTLLVMAASVMVMVLASSYLEPVLEFLRKLEALGNLNADMVLILFKVTGIGMITEIVGLVCTDAGNASLGKSLQILGTSVILWLSIPILDALLDMIQNILGEI